MLLHRLSFRSSAHFILSPQPVNAVLDEKLQAVVALLIQHRARNEHRMTSQLASAFNLQFSHAQGELRYREAKSLDVFVANGRWLRSMQSLLWCLPN